MSVYFCLVVVALLVPVTDSAICVASDQFESTYQMYNTEFYINVSNSVSRQVTALTTFDLDKNNKPRIYQRTVLDYNVKVEFAIAYFPIEFTECGLSKLRNAYMVTEIPDNAVRVDKFPLILPEDLPKGIEYWRFKWSDNNDAIVGVVRSPPNICSIVVWGPFDNQKELIIKSVTYVRGDYSLSIRNMDVFDVPPVCLSEKNKWI